jgi:hypothetical protein
MESEKHPGPHQSESTGADKNIEGNWKELNCSILYLNMIKKQCCESGFVGFASFWASRIRIRHYLDGYGSFRRQAKKVRKTLISTVLRLLYEILKSLKTDLNFPLKSSKLKIKL